MLIRMKNLYSQFGKWGVRGLCLIGVGSMQLSWAQVVPDVQWTSSGRMGLAIKTDGTILTIRGQIRGNFPGLGGLFAVNQSLSGSEIYNRPLEGTTPLGGFASVFGLPVAPIGEGYVLAAGSDGSMALVGRETNLATQLITKVNAAGNQVATRTIERADFFQTVNNFSTQIVFEDLVGTPDGGFLLLITSAEQTAKTITFVRKYDASLNSTWTRSVAFPTPNPASPDRSLTRSQAVINTPDGGYLLAGFYNTNGNLDAPETGWAAKLDNQGNVSWQKLLNNLPLTLDVNGPVANSMISLRSADDVSPTLDGTGYAFVGTATLPSSAGGPSSALGVLELNADGSFRRARSIGEVPADAFITRYNSGGQSVYAVATSITDVNVHPLIVLVNPSLDVVNRRAFVNQAPPYGAVTKLDRAGDGSLVMNTFQNLLLKLQAPVGGETFAVIQPTYNCATGAIAFNTTGGDRTQISYSAPGISRTSPTANIGTVEPGLRADPKPIPITATQSGQSSTFIFDLPGFCANPPTDGPLMLLAPTYSCQTGAITFNTSGGDATPIIYTAPGISRTSPTSNVGTVEPGLRADPKTIPITATQSGQSVTFVFNLPGACGGQARQVTEETGNLTINVLGNPTTGVVSVEVSGAEGQPLQLRLMNAQGRLVSWQHVEQATQVERHTFDLSGQPAGMWLLRAVSHGRTRTVKIVKQ